MMEWSFGVRAGITQLIPNLSEGNLVHQTRAPSFKKCLSASGLLVTVWDQIAWKMIPVLHFSLFTLCSLCDMLLVKCGHYNAYIKSVFQVFAITL